MHGDRLEDGVERPRCLEYLPPVERVSHFIAVIVQRRDAAWVWHRFEQHFNSLAHQAFGEVAQAGKVATGICQALREAETHRIFQLPT